MEETSEEKLGAHGSSREVELFGSVARRRPAGEPGAAGQLLAR